MKNECEKKLYGHGMERLLATPRQKIGAKAVRGSSVPGDGLSVLENSLSSVLVSRRAGEFTRELELGLRSLRVIRRAGDFQVRNSALTNAAKVFFAFFALIAFAGVEAAGDPYQLAKRRYYGQGSTFTSTPQEYCEIRRVAYNSSAPPKPYLYMPPLVLTGDPDESSDIVALSAGGNPNSSQTGISRFDCRYTAVWPDGSSYPNYAFTGVPTNYCGLEHIFDYAKKSCVTVATDRIHDKPNSCEPGFGHPIYPLTGRKRLVERLADMGNGRRNVTAGYDTRAKVPSVNGGSTFSVKPSASFGELWASSLHKSLVFQFDSDDIQRGIQASRGLGGWISFAFQSDGSFLPDADVSDRVESTSSGWRYIDAGERAIETYNSQGNLLGISNAGGEVLSYTYSDLNTSPSVAPTAGLLISVQDQFGRTVQFQYEQVGGSAARIKQVTAPSGHSIAVGYDASGNLSQLAWADGASRQYLYERADLPWALTGVIDENGIRFSTYGYDAQGRAIDTQLAGGVDHYSVSYASAPVQNIVETFDSAVGAIWRDHYWKLPQGTVLTKPNGGTSALNSTLVRGMPRLTSQSQAAGSGCAASSSYQTYDANANLQSRDDFNGGRACFVSDLNRNLETARVEGLSTSAVCGNVITANVVLPVGSRKVSTAWHPDWRLKTRVAEPGRITTLVYNGQPNPVNANIVASCAPASAKLPDGKPIAVLCEQIEQATTDADGHLGFTAPLQGGVAQQTQRWTYNQYGQVLTTSTPPLNNTTTYAYYTDTNFTGTDPNAVGHTQGDLQSVTNILGHVTNYTQYNKQGQVVQSIDANGVTTVNTYDLRLRLKSTSTGGQTTSYDYDLVGQLKQVTAPDGSWIGYEYDDAHRQTATKDNFGNRIEYTLDNDGRRTVETVKDPSGVLARNLARSIDALGRVQQTTGRE